MATFEECQEALHRLGALLSNVDPEARRKHALNRSVACTVPDLATTFRGDLHDGELQDIRTGDEVGAQIVLKVSSDDLVALTEGRLSFPVAWATGRLRIDASITDLLRLRALL